MRKRANNLKDCYQIVNYEGSAIDGTRQSAQFYILSMSKRIKMNLIITNLWKVCIFPCSVIICIVQLAYGQTKTDTVRIEKPLACYETKVVLTLHETVTFADSLTLSLTSFSHKRPYTGGPTKATAYLSLTRHELARDLTLSVQGIDGQSQQEDGLTEDERYDRVTWDEYEFQLIDFDYDKSIEIIVSKKK